MTTVRLMTKLERVWLFLYMLLLLLLFGLWVIPDRLEPCVVPTRRCRFMTVTRRSGQSQVCLSL